VTRTAESLEERLATRSLPGAVRSLLGDDATIATWESGPLTAQAVALDRDASLLRFSGLARKGREEVPWRLILKVSAPTPGRENPDGGSYWRREADLYGTDTLSRLGEGVRAPACHGSEIIDGRLAWVWLAELEDLLTRWPFARWGEVARRLGRFNGAHTPGSVAVFAPEAAASLSGERLRATVERHEPLLARIVAGADDPRVNHWWPRPIVDRIVDLWDRRRPLCDMLVALPRGLVHGDAIRRNLFTDARGDVVAIDWECAGFAALGEEVGQLLSVATAFFDAETEDLPRLDDLIFASYLEGLRDVGWRGNECAVRFAYCAHAALRNIFNAVGTALANEAQQAHAVQRFSHPDQELARRRAEARPFLLARADEAWRLVIEGSTL